MRRKLVGHYRRQVCSLAPGAPETPGAPADFFRPANGHWREEAYPQACNVPTDDVQAQQQCQGKLPARHRAVFVLRCVEE